MLQKKEYSGKNLLKVSAKELLPGLSLLLLPCFL